MRTTIVTANNLQAEPTTKANEIKRSNCQKLKEYLMKRNISFEETTNGNTTIIAIGNAKPKTNNY